MRDLDDRGRPSDMWKRYKIGDRFWLTHEADKTHYWAQSESGTSTGLIARDAVQLPEINKWACTVRSLEVSGFKALADQRARDTTMWQHYGDGDRSPGSDDPTVTKCPLASSALFPFCSFVLVLTRRQQVNRVEDADGSIRPSVLANRVVEHSALMKAALLQPASNYKMRPALVAALVASLALPVLVSSDDCSSESMAALAAHCIEPSRASARP